jgi:hypothetical protein
VYGSSSMAFNAFQTATASGFTAVQLWPPKRGTVPWIARLPARRVARCSRWRVKREAASKRSRPRLVIQTPLVGDRKDHGAFDRTVARPPIAAHSGEVAAYLVASAVSRF